MKSLLKEEKAQTSLEYLYLTAFAVGVVAIIAILINDVMTIQARAESKVNNYKDEVFRIIAV
ncbi:hypothetical protein K8R43_00865 [archaeon]|nr:hypothetical protein [archaeon]